MKLIQSGPPGNPELDLYHDASDDFETIFDGDIEYHIIIIGQDLFIVRPDGRVCGLFDENGTWHVFGMFGSMNRFVMTMLKKLHKDYKENTLREIQNG